MRAPEGQLKIEQSKILTPKGDHLGIVYASSPSLGEGQTCLIIAHGAGGPMYSPFITFFHKALAEKGYLSVKFNFSYMEARRKIPDKRDVLESNYRQVIEQAKASKYRPKRIFVGGKSMGGRIASQVVASGMDVDGLFFLGYPLHRPGQPELLRDEHLYQIERPMLFISGTKDQFAKRELLDRVVSRLGDRAEIHWIEGGDHSFNTANGEEALVETYDEALETVDTWVKTRGI
ncbi:MAG TPA: alpha/beta family hydrolase [Candidatus Bathyarchaeia archaeon]|nr:alpha/beta family hydrolase [Candidatus Bathyarchaeia archaeon]